MAEKTIRQLERDEQIYQITTLVAGRFSLQEVLDKLAEAAVRIVGVKACSIRLLDEEAGELKMRSTYGLSEEYRNKGVVSKNDPVVKAAFEGQAVVLDDMRVDGRVQYKEATIKEGLVSQLTVAMQFRDRPIGVLRLYSPRPKHFDQDDIVLARSVASQCAVAITNARLYEEAIEGQHIAEQMRLAGAIQRRMIPKQPPKIKGLDIAATYIPCFDVGGDFYDFFDISDSSFSLAIADVMGKGLPAALMMSCLRGAVHAYADSHIGQQAIGAIVDKLNKAACQECTEGSFISLFYAAIDNEEKSITYCSCGHEPAALFRDEKVINLEKGGMVLGVVPDAEYEVDTIELQQSDVLLFYTDGLVDARNFEGEFWGRDRMLESAGQFLDRPTEQLLKNVLAYRRRFVGLASQCDDTSLVVVKVIK
jgi:serine phosphatase RsbU (regulator of sigma subunit)